MNDLIQMLHDEHLTCIVKQQGNLYKEFSNGIKPILHLLDEHHLQDAILVDKVIGKAAALLMIQGKVSTVHACILSEHAKQIFDKFQITYSYDLLVPYIINRSQTGMCPMESTVLQIDDPALAENLLRDKIKTM